MERLRRIIGDPKVLTSFAFLAGVLLGFMGAKVMNPRHRRDLSLPEEKM